MKALQGFAFTKYAIPVNCNTKIPCKNYKVAKIWPYIPFCPPFPTRYILLECEGKCKYEKIEHKLLRLYSKNLEVLMAKNNLLPLNYILFFSVVSKHTRHTRK